MYLNDELSLDREDMLRTLHLLIFSTLELKGFMLSLILINKEIK